MAVNFTSALAITNAAVNIPLSTTAILGNLLVLVSIARTPSLISPSNVLLLNLACTDLCVGLVVQPLYIALKFIQFTDTEKNIETPFLVLTYVGAYLCIVPPLNVTFTLLSVERFLALHLHLRYKEFVTVKRTVTYLGILWMVTAIGMSLRARFEMYISSIIATSIGCLASLVNVILYYKIYRIVRRHQLQINSQAQIQSNTASVNITHLKRSFANMFYVNLFLRHVTCRSG